MSKVTVVSRPNRITIASKGVQGAPGPDGPQGIQGPKGDTGDVTPAAIAARDAAQEAASSAQDDALAAAGSAAAADGAAQARVQELRDDLADPAGGADLVANPDGGTIVDGLVGRRLDASDPAGSVATAKARGLPLMVAGEQSVPSIFLNSEGLAGAGGQASEGGQTLTLTEGPIECGFGNISLAERSSSTKMSSNAPIIGVNVRATFNDKPLLVNTECHWQTIERSSIRMNTLLPGVPLVKFNASLYNRVLDSDFGHGQGDGIRGIESQFDVAYYGVNASWFARNNFNGEGTSAHLHGVFSFRDSTIENTNSTAPKIRIGDAGRSNSSNVVIDNVYIETRTKTTEPVLHSPVQIESNCNISISNSVIASASNHYNTPWDGTNGPSIKATAGITHGSIRNNSLQPGVANLVNGWAKAIDWTLTGNGYVEFVNNYWNTTADVRIFVDGVDVATRGEIGSAGWSRRIYIRDRQHGELKQNIPERNVWLDHTASQSLDWRVDGGKHLAIAAPTAGDVQVTRRAAWKGARFTVHFRGAVPLKHGNDFFLLAKGSDVTIPAGWVLDFVIDLQGRVREVGASTMHL